MDKLLGALVGAWCWLRVAASPTLIGAALGAGAYYLIGGTSGLVVGGLLVILGLYFGLRLANYARRKGQLVEFAHGLPPSESTSIEGGDVGGPSVLKADKLITCVRHGQRPATFVCQHIAASLSTRVAVGFHWPADSDQEFPDACCSECHARHEQCGWEWTGEAASLLGAKLLCSSCYLEARRLCLGRRG